MSTRTIIEINHDYLADLDADVWESVMQELRATRIVAALNTGRPVLLRSGIRVLAQRHHSEPLDLTIK